MANIYIYIYLSYPSGVESTVKQKKGLLFWMGEEERIKLIVNKQMNQNYLPLDRSPLVNIRRAIQRSNAKRQANIIVDSESTRTALKEFYKNASNRYCNQENDISGEEETRFSYNDRRMQQKSSLYNLRRSEGGMSCEYLENELIRVNKGNREFRIKRYQNSQARCKSDSSLDKEIEQAELQNNITVFNLIPKRSYLQKQNQEQRRRNHTVEDIGKKGLPNSRSLSTRGQLLLKFKNSSMPESKMKQKRKIKSVQRIEFCPWSQHQTFYNPSGWQEQSLI